MVDAVTPYPYIDADAFIDAVKLPIVPATLDPVGTKTVVVVLAGNGVDPDTTKVVPLILNDPLPGVANTVKLNAVVAVPPSAKVLVEAILAVAAV